MILAFAEIKNIMKFTKHILILSLLLTAFNCGPYSFTGASISADTKTFQVNYFQNNAPLVEPGLERDFTLAMQDLILNQTSLDLVRSNGDLVYEGEITEFRIAPMTSTAQNTAAQNRLTIGVNVRFFDKNDPEAELERRFSFYYDYPASDQLVGSVKDTAISEIFDRITQDVFQATLAKW